MNARLLGPAMVIVIAAIACLIESNVPHRQRERLARDFQSLLGGLGFGPALDLSESTYGFDPRLNEVCVHDGTPTPGAGCMPPGHVGFVFSYRTQGDGDDSTP